MTRRTVLQGMTAAATAAVLPWPRPVAGAAATRPQHVLNILLDDAEWPDFGFLQTAYTNPDIDTPNIDAIRSSGVFLENFYVSNPGCAPTRYSFLSGGHPMRYGITAAESDNAQASRTEPTGGGITEPTMADMARSAGYTTGHIGKWHLGLSKPDYRPAAVGYDFAAVKVSGGSWGDIGLQRVDDSVDVQTTPYADVLYGDEAVGFVASNASTFLNLWLHTPHTSWDFDHGWYDNSNGYDLATARGQKQAVMHIADREIGRLLAQYPNLDDVLVTVTSDNGAPSKSRQIVDGAQHPEDPQRGYKRSHYEGGVNMPFVAAWPNGGIPQDAVMTGLMTSYDLASTQAVLIGGTDPAGRLSQDRSAVLLGTHAADRGPIFFESKTTPHGRKKPDESRYFSVIDWPYKYVQGEPDDLTWRLFNIANDPSEDSPLPAPTAAEHAVWMRTLHRLRAEASAVPLTQGANPFQAALDPWARPWTMRIRFDTADQGQTLYYRADHLRVRLAKNGRLKIDLWHTDPSTLEKKLTKRRYRTSPGAHVLMIGVEGFKRGYPVVRTWLDNALVNEDRAMYTLWSTDDGAVVNGDVALWAADFRPGEWGALA